MILRKMSYFYKQQQIARNGSERLRTICWGIASK